MLDKKALRKFANDNPAPAIPVGHGLLHASQVVHIIRSAVKIIGHRRTLVLYVYDRKQAAGGDPSPVWTMFQAGDDYITLARHGDGSTDWRTAAFENLVRDYYFKEKCAFYSARDEQHVCDFFRDHDHGGMAALVRAQKAILGERALQREARKDRKVLACMAGIPALPGGLEDWARREILPAYFRCWHTSARKPVTGTCTSCGKEFTLPGAAHNAKTTCPHCKRELTVKSAGKTGRHCDRDTVQVVEKINGTEVVARIVKVYYSYNRDHLMPTTIRTHENARIFVRRTPDGKVAAEPYYYSYGKGTLTHWMPGERPMFKYCENFEAVTCGHVYCKGLMEALTETPWQYCPVEAFYNHFREPMQLTPFLQAYLEHPRLEHLVKTGFFSLADGLAYRCGYAGTLDESQNRTHRILQVAAEDVPFLRELDPDMGALEVFQGYAGLKDRQRLLRWQLDNQVTRDVEQVLEHVTAHKLMKYIDAQFAALRLDVNKGRYATMQHAVSEYRDYLDMCVQLGYDMGNSFVLYPKDLREAHDRVARRVKAKTDAKLRRDFKTAMEAISGHLDFEADGMKMVLPANAEDLAAEGNALHHCVGSYANRVARKECVILFLRRREAPNEPFYTVEVQGKKVIQVRGFHNGDPTPEVEAFMTKWERQVLQAA